MNEIIPIANCRIGDETIQTINARELHTFLVVGKDFTTWIKDRIDQFGFIEGEDYVTAQELSTPKSGSAMARTQRTVAYHLSLNMAKELSMVERNEKGKQARQYFIECERRAKERTQPAELSRMDILKLAMESEQGRIEAEAKLALAAPKVIFFDKVVQKKTLMSATQVAQKLGMSAIKLNKHLDELGIYAMGVKRARVFKQWVIDKGLGELKQTELGYSQPLFTTAGEAWIVERLTSEGVAS